MDRVEVVASALIRNREGKVLLIRSHKWGDEYLVPGGHVEPGEAVVDAAKREGEEETGLQIRPLFCVNIGELINSPSFHRPAHLVYFHFVCEALTETITLQEDELKDYEWLTPNDALSKKLTIGVDQAIKNYIVNKRFDITSHSFRN
jgi:nucleoside triphosphatase